MLLVFTPLAGASMFGVAIHRKSLQVLSQSCSGALQAGDLRASSRQATFKLETGCAHGLARKLDALATLGSARDLQVGW